MPVIEKKQRSCDACGLDYLDPNFSGHNCFEVIKLIGKVEFARELVDMKSLLEIRQALDAIIDHAPMIIE